MIFLNGDDDGDGDGDEIYFRVTVTLIFCRYLLLYQATEDMVNDGRTVTFVLPPKVLCNIFYAEGYISVNIKGFNIFMN